MLGANTLSARGAYCESAGPIMSTDYREKEREFLDNLKGDTGRDVAEWMAAISAQALPHRNDIIDWLRQQGFMFSKASWLERVHHNGGKPIYGERAHAAAAAQLAKMPAAAAAAGPAPLALRNEPPSQMTLTAGPSTSASPPRDVPALDALLTEAKAYRPLAQYILAEIARAVPGVVIEPRPGYAALSSQHGRTFAALAISAKELRLAAGFKGAKPPAPWQTVRMAKPWPSLPPHLAHMIRLTDARQVTDELLQWIASAAT